MYEVDHGDATNRSDRLSATMDAIGWRLRSAGLLLALVSRETRAR